jgi:cytoskeletal protein RodZ
MPSFGERLRRERELRGVSLRDVADATKISTRFLKALEDDRVDLLPGGLFPRAFVRQYAKQLGLDADRLVAEFLYDHGGLGEPPPRPRSPEAPPRGGLFVVFVCAGLALLGLLKAGSREDAPAPALEAAAPAPAPVATVYAPASALPEDAAAAGLAASEGLVLTLRAEQSCWVEVRADGERVLSRVLGAGEIATLQADGELVLSVGNAGGLSFSVNDRPGVSLGRSGEVRRNVVITKHNLPALVEDAEPASASHSS